MLYSCLVDADYIDTETFMNGDAGRGNYEPLSALCDKLTAYISKWNNPTREIDILRQKFSIHALKRRLRRAEFSH